MSGLSRYGIIAASCASWKRIEARAFAFFLFLRSIVHAGSSAVGTSKATRILYSRTQRLVHHTYLSAELSGFSVVRSRWYDICLYMSPSIGITLRC